MKWLCKTLIIFLIIFFTLKNIIHILDKGHNTKYEINGLKIEEKYTAKTNEYLFKISNEDNYIIFNVYKDYNKASNIIKDITYTEKSGYKCFFPKFKNGDELIDAMCLKDNIINYNQNLNLNLNIDETKYYDTANYKEEGSLKIYETNLIKNHYLYTETYKGVKIINNKELNVFNNDIYIKKLSIQNNQNYIVADYNQKYSFNNFYVINIQKGKQTLINNIYNISFDSYIQGQVGNKVYLFDKDSEIQYEIDIKEKTVKKVAIKKNIKYYNGNWTTMDLVSALKETKFKPYGSTEIPGFYKVDKIGNIYYAYEKVDNYYKVYKSFDKKQFIYLFTTTNIDSINYVNDYIYYINFKTVFRYKDSSKKIMENSELEFNKTIKYGVYSK